MSKPLFVVRGPGEEDLPFIFNSWLKSFRDSPQVQGVPNTLYYAEQHALIGQLLKDSYVLIACNPDDPGQIYGYAVGCAKPEPDHSVLHWVYVKHPFRNFGIAKALVHDVCGDRPLYYTHRVKNSDRIAGDRSATFNPYL